MAVLSGMILKEEITKSYDKQQIEGYVLIRSYSEQPTKTGSSYLSGSLDARGEVSFKVWRGACFDLMKEHDMSGMICKVFAEVNEYGGQKSLILNSISPYSDEEIEELGFRKADFFVSKYNSDAQWNGLVTRLQKKVSPEAYKVFELLLKDTKERFTSEFAAINYHDNCKGGLLAHSLKVVKLASLIDMYPSIVKHISSDVLYVGCAIHDIGKILEYSNGAISSMGKILSHNTMGCIMLEKHKGEIVSLTSEDFYNALLSIIAQHHGEYGDTPRTIAAYVVNQLDCLDATMTLLNTRLEESGDDVQISFDNMKLS